MPIAATALKTIMKPNMGTLDRVILLALVFIARSTSSAGAA